MIFERGTSSLPSLRGTKPRPEASGAEGCDEAISLSLTDCKEQTDYHVTSLAQARLSPRNDESA